MKFRFSALAASLLVIPALCVAVTQAQTFTKQTTKTEKFDFGAGGTIVITGAPRGSITIVASQRNEVEITAVTDVAAATQADLDRLAPISGFVVDETPMRATLITVGPHNRFGQKKLPKGFPKGLEQLPIKVDYTISVPRYTDLEIDGGVGDVTVRGIEGSIRVSMLESKAAIDLIAGDGSVMIGKGTADVSLGIKGWRGRSAKIALGSGDLTVRLPSTLSADIDATVMKTGSIENTLTDLKPRDRNAPFTERSIFGRAGVGGASVRFAVGDGRILLKRLGAPE